MKARGRPPLIPGLPATACITIRVPPTLREELARVACDNHTTRADVIRAAVNEYVADYQERRIFPSIGSSTN